MIDPSLLTKFRKTRITEDILEEPLRETIRQTLDQGLIKSGSIIVDSTHTNASVCAKSPTQILRDMSLSSNSPRMSHHYNLPNCPRASSLLISDEFFFKSAVFDSKIRKQFYVYLFKNRQIVRASQTCCPTRF